MADKKDDIYATDLQDVHPTHGAFIHEGLMVAFPLCFPGVTDPIPLEESRITALAPDGCEMLYGGTSGKGVHLFAADFRGPTGAVWDLGAIEGASECTGIACGDTWLVAAVNGENGSRLIRRKREDTPGFDLLQEWSFVRRRYSEVTWKRAEERVLDLAGIAGQSQAVGISEHHLFVVDIDQGECHVVDSIDSHSHLIADVAGRVYGLDGPDALWCFEPAADRLTRRAVSLPPGRWDERPVVWTGPAGDAGFFAVDGDGRICLILPNSGGGKVIAQAPLPDVQCLAVIPDGRVYGFCGDQIAHLFVFDPANGVTTDLGVAVSVIERRRYGYQFAAAVTGRDGHIFFGENDNLGHLWMYFPAIRPRDNGGSR